MTELFLLLCMLLFLPVNSSFITWGKEEFTQIKKIDSNNAILKNNVKTIVIYEQFSLLWCCDVLFVSREVSNFFIDVYAIRNNSDQNEKENLIKKEYEDQKQKITFIFLLPYQINFNEQSEWQIRLKIKDQLQKPIAIKLIELEPEYYHFFGEKYTRLKQAYKITFEKKDNFNIAHEIKLIFSNTLGSFESSFLIKK